MSSEASDLGSEYNYLEEPSPDSPLVDSPTATAGTEMKAFGDDGTPFVDIRKLNDPSKAPVKLPISPVPFGIEAHRAALVESFHAALSRDLFVWKTFPMALPPTVAARLKDLNIDITKIFKTPAQSEDELRDLSL